MPEGDLHPSDHAHSQAHSFRLVRNPFCFSKKDSRRASLAGMTYAFFLVRYSIRCMMNVV